jgi:Lsr2
MQLTIDSTEPLDHVLRVVESLYGVHLSATTAAPAATAARPAGTGSRATRSPRNGKTATSAKPTAASRRSASRSVAKTDPATVRNWARANGHTIRDRGRVPATVLAAYKTSTKAT